VIILVRSTVCAFTNEQIQLIETFADQAVIAIENVRLFEEARARTADLSEALDRQTATSEVLQVISSSPGELEPVFQAMLENAMRICEAKFGIMFGFAHGAFRALSWLGIPPDFADYLGEPRVWGRTQASVNSPVPGKPSTSPILTRGVLIPSGNQAASPPPKSAGSARSSAFRCSRRVN
jgi:hypothetical protein